MNEQRNAKTPVLRKISASNLLSFGADGLALELPALTVLIGPNGSGKTNLLEAIGLLKAAPTEIPSPRPRRGRNSQLALEARPPSNCYCGSHR